MTQSFVARIWLELAAEGDPKWRGHIQHIQGGEEVYFQDLTEMREFLELVSGVPGPPVSSATEKRRRDPKPRFGR